MEYQSLISVSVAIMVLLYMPVLAVGQLSVMNLAASLPASGRVTWSPLVTTATPVKACRVRCYQTYQQDLQRYCRGVTRYCSYANNLGRKCNACYKQCKVAPTLHQAFPSSPAIPQTTPTLVTASRYSPSPTLITDSPEKVCQVRCYKVYQQELQRYCNGVIRFCSYANTLGRKCNNCYRQCKLEAAAGQSPASFLTTPSTPPKQQPGCGASTYERAANPGPTYLSRIVGGQTAQECEFPWIVALTVTASQKSRTFCGGSILDSNTVVTAAHCVYKKKISTISVHYGSSALARMTSVNVSNVAVHPKFNPRYFDYDVAVLTLEKDVRFNACTYPVCLAPVGSDPSNAQFCQAAGWGALQFNQPSVQSVLRKVTLPIVPESQCRRAYNSRLISPIKICAGDLNRGGIDACLGDSGGPLTCTQGGLTQLHGVVSFGSGCARPRKPGVHTRLSHPQIHAWILANL